MRSVDSVFCRENFEIFGRFCLLRFVLQFEFLSPAAQTILWKDARPCPMEN